jgi:hypothetical protein
MMIATFLLTLLFGGMVFFAAVMTPLIFTHLPAKTARGFIRAVFPVYYAYTGFLMLAAALCLLSLPAASFALVVSAGLTFWSRQWLMPRINRLSDRAQSGDLSAERGFDLAHRASVMINLLQLISLAGLLIGLLSGRWR